MTNDHSEIESHYTKLRIFLHWLSALVILWASATGFWASFLSHHSPIRHFINFINPQITTAFMPFFGWRVVLYAESRPWAVWPSASPQERLALFVHGCLYTTIMVVLVTGLLMMPSPWKLFGILPIPVLGILQDQLFLVHRISCMVLVGLIAMHLTAVFYHLCNNTPILQKMSLRAPARLNFQDHAVITGFDAMRE